MRNYATIWRIPMNKELKNSIKEGNVILFVGSGISATLGLPSWSQLISHIASELGYDDRIFKSYGDNLILAEFYEISKGHIGELRSWMDTKWTVELEKIRESPIYEKIVKLNFPIIYTTNYDHCIETTFEAWNKNYKKIVSVDDFVNIDSLTTQIVKFHGDTISDDSIVLTESSYFERLAFESPLDVKLRADMLGKSILFIGYSLSDINIRLLIYKLDQLWKRSNNYCKRPKSYVFLPAPNPIQETILNNRGIQAIVGEKLDKTESIDTFLKTLL